MSSSNTTETTSTSPGPTSSKQKTSACETVNHESTNGKNLLHSLKGQVSFAKQCLGLLQNQMKHAMDTLDILQDQVNKAQSTIDKIERKGNKQACSQKIQSVVVGNDYQASVDELPPGAVPLQGHRMLVVDSNGQPLYAIDKSVAASYGIPVQHQNAPCHCPSCNNVSLGHPVFLTEQGQQLIAIHSGQAVYHMDGKQASSPASSSHDTVEKKDECHTASTPDYNCSKKRKYSSASMSSDTEESPSPRESQSINEPSNLKSLSDSKSSSPIASQLLQVIDVLQNAGDDDNKEPILSSRSLRGHSSSIPFTGPVPQNPIHTPLGTGILSAVGRRCRKQDIGPFKREEAGIPSHLQKPERDLPELMRVPPPVLAGTLEPDFLVVPGNSYFSDSPPASAGGTSQERERLGSTERRHSETRTSSIVEVKKEHIEKVEPPRSSSASSLSQASDASSRSTSESCCSEKSVSHSFDASRRPEVISESHIPNRNEHEHTPHHVEDLSSYHPNGDSQKSDDADVTKSTHSIAIPTRASLLNSTSTDKDATDTTQLSTKKSQLRVIKVSPLNSAVTGSTMELRRPAIDYTSNHGIVRISNATSMSSSSSSSLSQQTNNTSAETPTFSNNDIHKSSLNSFAHSCNSNSDIQMVTTYSVAEITSDEQKCPSPSKRPNILSRNRQNKKEIPQGIVVLVPTIEDAKQLIKSSGGNKGSTPVLVPQNILNQISANGESSKTSTTDSRVTSPSYIGKRSHYSESGLSYSRAKKSLSEPLVID